MSSHSLILVFFARSRLLNDGDGFEIVDRVGVGQAFERRAVRVERERDKALEAVGLVVTTRPLKLFLVEICVICGWLTCPTVPADTLRTIRDCDRSSR